jgi:acid phosphatase (class A)
MIPFIPLAALVWVASVPALAEEPLCPRVDAVPLMAMLLPPPCDACEETRAELAELFILQKTRSSDQANHASGDQKRSVDRFLGEIGMKIGGRSPFVDQFFKCVAHAVENSIGKAKAAFHRTRPYKLPDNGLQPLKELRDDDSFSYPSGHAAYGTVIGLMLAEMIPEKRREIIARVQDYGLSRMVAGVHFRSDVYAGQIAGATIAMSLFKNDDFRSEFDTAKVELRKALGY